MNEPQPQTTPAPYPLTPSRSALVVIDLQDSLARAVADSAGIFARAALLIRAAGVLKVPVVVTTQNAERLGPLCPRIVESLPAGCPQIDKITFSAWGSEEFRTALQATGADQIVICGIETHICVAQTAIDLRLAGFAATVVADAVGARSVERHKLGMERIRDLGVLPAATESVVYEWLGRAGTPEFRAILPLVKSL